MEKIILGPHDALITVDMTGAFMRGGGLPVDGAEEIIELAVSTASRFPQTRRIATRDIHTPGCISEYTSYVGLPKNTFLTADKLRPEHIGPNALFTFEECLAYLPRTVDGGQVLWNPHGHSGTLDAKLHPYLKSIAWTMVFDKASNPKRDSYSAFSNNLGEQTGLRDYLKTRGITRVFCIGLAFDFCVGFTALDARSFGFEAFVIEDVTRSVNFNGSAERMRQRLHDVGVHLIHSSQIL